MRTYLFLALAFSLSATACNRPVSQAAGGSPMSVSGTTPTKAEYDTFVRQEKTYIKELALDKDQKAQYEAWDEAYREAVKKTYQNYDPSDREALLPQMREAHLSEAKNFLSDAQYTTLERMENNLGTARDRFYGETDFGL